MRQQLGAAPSRVGDEITKSYSDSAAQTLANKTIDGTTSTINNVPAANLTGTVPLVSIPGGIPQNSISGLVGSLAGLLGTTTFQSLVDSIANALGHTGTGYTVSQVETYLGVIPAGNLSGTLATGNIPGLPTSQIVSGTFSQSMITGLTTSLNALLPTTTYQSLVDAIANALGHTGTGHTWNDIETYFGIIPATNLTGTVPLASIPSGIPQNSISGLVTSLAGLLGTTTFQTLLDSISHAMGQTGTGHTVTQVETYLGLIPATNLSGTVPVASIPSGIPQNSISGLVTSLAGLLGTTTFQTLLDNISNALGHSGTGHTVTDVETYLGVIPPANVANVLGGSNLGADLTSVNSTVSGHTTSIGTNTSNISTNTTNISTNATRVSRKAQNDLILGDGFHSTYPLGTSSDTAATLVGGKRTWWGAWNDNMTLLGQMLGITAPTDPASDVGTTVAGHTTSISTNTSNIATTTSTLNTTNTNLFGSTTPGTAITTSAVPSGIPATKIANVLGGANLSADLSSVNSTANTVQSTLNTTNTNLFGSTTPASTITTTAVPTGIPATKLSNLFGGATLSADLTNLATALYGGTTVTSTSKVAPTSVANVLGGSSLSADLTSVNSTVGGHTTSIATNSTNIATNTTNVNNTWSWLFGTTSPTSTSPVQATKVATPLGGASLNADLTALGNLFFGSPTVGTAVRTAALPNIAAGSGAGQSADLLTHLTNVASQTGATGSTAVSAAQAALQTQSNTLNTVASALQTQKTQDAGASNSGQAYTVYFGNYSSGSFSQSPFNVTYGNIPGASSHGSGDLVINSSGQAAWSAVNDGDVSAFGLYTPSYTLSFSATPTAGSFTLTYVSQLYNTSATTSAIAYNATAATIQTALQALSNMPGSGVTVTAGTAANSFIITFAYAGPLTVTSSLTGATAAVANNGYTNTDYQKLDASLGGFPNGGNSKNFAFLRANAAGTDYVYGVVYLNTSFQLNWEIGCYTSSTQHVWASGTNAPLNLNFTFIAGVGNDPNHYQGYSGSTQVFDHINVSGDPGGLYPVNSTHRYWGFRSDTYNNGQTYPAPASYVGCADNQPPTIPGSGIRLYHTGTTSITQAISIGTTYSTLGDGSTQFWDSTSESSSDMTVLSNMLIGSFDSRIAQGQVAGVQVANAGRYIVSLRSDISAATCSSGAVSICAAARRYNSAGTLQETRLFPSPGFFVNGFGGQYDTGFFGGSEVIGCKTGDILQAGYYLSSGPAATGALSALSFTGDSTGGHTYFEVTLANWSFN